MRHKTTRELVWETFLEMFVDLVRIVLKPFRMMVGLEKEGGEEKD